MVVQLIVAAPSNIGYAGLVGYIILITSTNPALSYFATYLAAAYVCIKSHHANILMRGIYCRAIYPTIREFFVLLKAKYLLITFQ
jgi:hypothetical protein